MELNKFILKCQFECPIIRGKSVSYRCITITIPPCIVCELLYIVTAQTLEVKLCSMVFLIFFMGTSVPSQNHVKSYLREAVSPVTAVTVFVSGRGGSLKCPSRGLECSANCLDSQVSDAMPPEGATFVRLKTGWSNTVNIIFGI